MDSRIDLNTDPQPTASPDIHYCRAGESCAGRSRHPESLDWIPRTTEHPNSVCTRCRRHIESAVTELWDDYCCLNNLFLVPTEHAGSEIRSGAPKSQVPVNVVSDALMHDIGDAIYRCAAAITPNPEGSAQTPFAQFVTCRGIVQRNIEALLAAPRTKHLLWNRSGDNYIAEMLDGIDLALALVNLHRRACALVGVERPRERMPVPCPQCESRQLGRDINPTGPSDVNCRACGSSWTDAQYRRLTQVGAAIMKGEQPE